ncbi:hypothetical protein GPA27_01160 [Aromatoleum toluolicum]|uniref:Uncharacterized protein n=1 Tax=Aromatoleum toluolicum TaxID=90060 RepID=A0ABX1N9T9_9RHOO|nr:hypothetical protein [Aromatoleum toluolicum]NMF96004.1 hypothetical protein [Aromatoleum toluolicum]
MNLGKLISRELNVGPEHIMLLRHSNTLLPALLNAGGTIEEYTLVQPSNSRYDFHADGKPQIDVVAVIVSDLVHVVYRILGVERHGTTRTLVSPHFQRFDVAHKFPERDAKLFAAEEIQSTAVTRPIRGWTSPRTPVARFGGLLFESVEIF